MYFHNYHITNYGSIKYRIEDKVDYYSIELVRKDSDNVPMYFLLSREFTWHKAEKRFKDYVRQYPNARIELNSTHWINTDMGYMPIAWAGSL